MEYIVRKNSTHNEIFELTTRNGGKVNVLVEKHYGGYADKSESWYVDQIKNQIENEYVNVYPFVSGLRNIKIIGFSIDQDECVAFDEADYNYLQRSKVIRDGGYVVLFDMYYNTSDIRQVDYLYYDFLFYDAYHGIITFLNKKYGDGLRIKEGISDENIRNSLVRNGKFSAYIGIDSVDVTIFKISLVPKSKK